jgi:hypothetical protein
MLCRYKLPMRIQTERNKRKLIQEEFIYIPKLQIIPEHSNKQVFTLNTGTPIENQIEICKFNKVWELSDPEKKKTDPDISSYLSVEAEGHISSRV